MFFLLNKEKPDLEKFEQFNNFDQEMFRKYQEDKKNNRSRTVDYELHYFDFLDNQ